MDDKPQLPIAALIGGLILATAATMLLIVLLFSVAALASEGFFHAGLVLRFWLAGLVFALPLALLIGAPLAIWRLRDPDAGTRRWAGTGAIAGIAASIALHLVFSLLTNIHAFLGPETLMAAAGMAAITIAGSIVAALFTRRIAHWLVRRFGRAAA